MCIIFFFLCQLAVKRSLKMNKTSSKHEWVTQFSMGFRWTTELLWVKSCSTTLWPFHRPGPSKIKGEHRGKSVIKSETLIVNFPLCHYCTVAHTHTWLTLILPAMEVMTPCTSTKKGMRPLPIIFSLVCIKVSMPKMMYLRVQMYGWKIYMSPLVMYRV